MTSPIRPADYPSACGDLPGWRVVEPGSIDWRGTAAAMLRRAQWDPAGVPAPHGDPSPCAGGGQASTPKLTDFAASLPAPTSQQRHRVGVGVAPALPKPAPGVRVGRKPLWRR